MNESVEEKELRILFLEDVPTDAELMVEELRAAGMDFAFERVDTREAFVQALDEFGPNIILADYKLPSFDGRTALQIVQKTHPEIPVIMVSGVLGVGAVELLKEGARDYVLKDRLERLAPAIQRALAEDREAMARKQAEDELRKYRDHLEELVRQRTAELNQRTEELEQANIKLKELDRLKSLFIASMSHELRTPLNSIIGFTGVMLQGMAGPVNEEQAKQLTLVKESASHLLSLINDIIDLSKIEAGKADVAIGDFDLAEVAREVADSFSVMVKMKGIELAVSAPSALMVASDRKMVRQILVNLVGNAVKFTDSGRVDVILSRRDDRVEIAIQDTGIGLRKEDISKLFTAFSQVRIEGRPMEGTGLGLYLSQKIAHVLGGQVSVWSELGKGSRFTLSLPSRPEPIDQGMKDSETVPGHAK